jgi:hypothetical protein
MSALTIHIVTNLGKKEKEKKRTKISNERSKAKQKSKKRSLERASLDPLRQGQQLNTTKGPN